VAGARRPHAWGREEPAERSTLLLEHGLAGAAPRAFPVPAQRSPMPVGSHRLLHGCRRLDAGAGGSPEAGSAWDRVPARVRPGQILAVRSLTDPKKYEDARPAAIRTPVVQKRTGRLLFYSPLIRAQCADFTSNFQHCECLTKNVWR
jgi:hypothetical protein